MEELSLILLRKRKRSLSFKLTRAKLTLLGLAGGLLLTASLGGLLSVHLYARSQEELTALKKEKEKLEETLSLLVVRKKELLELLARKERELLKLAQEKEREERRAKELEESLQELEEKIYAIDRLLKKKGIKSLPDSVGGAGSPELLKEEAEKVIKTLSSVPLGLPVEGTLTSRYGYRRDPFTGRKSFHRGVDIKAPYGTPVRTPADGVVIFAGRKLGFGKVVVIRHAYGYETLYAHLSAVKVKKGQKVKAGEVIGLVGTSGRATGPHLHYEIKRWGRDLNPLELMLVRW